MGKFSHGAKSKGLIFFLDIAGDIIAKTTKKIEM